MTISVDSEPVSSSCDWPCAVCKRDMGGNSILRIVCGDWVHIRCSDVIDSLSKVPDFHLQCLQREPRNRTKGGKY